jgi:hypothetical protein
VVEPRLEAVVEPVDVCLEPCDQGGRSATARAAFSAAAACVATAESTTRSSSAWTPSSAFLLVLFS